MDSRAKTLLRLMEEAINSGDDSPEDENVVSYTAVKYSSGSLTRLWEVQDNLCESLRSCTSIISEDFRRETGKLPSSLSHFVCYPSELCVEEKLHYFYGLPRIDGTALHGFVFNDTWWLYGEESEINNFIAIRNYSNEGV